MKADAGEAHKFIKRDAGEAHKCMKTDAGEAHGLLDSRLPLTLDC